MTDNLARYLTTFNDRAMAAGLSMKSPGKNWAPMQPLVKGCHISLSVERHRIRVNLNNDQDASRAVYNQLQGDDYAIETEIGEGLQWEQKDGRKKTAVRATRKGGYGDGDWLAQHDWAIDMMRRFDLVFRKRLHS